MIYLLTRRVMFHNYQTYPDIIEIQFGTVSLPNMTHGEIGLAQFIYQGFCNHAGA